MKKIFLSAVLSSAIAPSFAYFNYADFQAFDNQIGFGIATQTGNFNTGQTNGNPNQFSITSLNLEVEKLFDVGLWLDVNTSVAQTYTETSMGTNGSAAPLGSYPYLQALNGKAGYNIPLADHFSVTPYLLLGKNANLSLYNSVAGMPTPPDDQGVNVTNDFYYTFGGGLRLEFPINQYVDVYFDQLYAYNSDQTRYTLDPAGLSNGQNIITSNNQWTSTLGVKVNPYSKLLLAANMFYTNYDGYSQNSLTVLNSLGFGVPTTAFGGQVSVGFTFQ